MLYSNTFKYHYYTNDSNKGKERENSHQKLKSSPHTQTIHNILMATDFFLNQKRVNVCEHTTNMVSLESFLKVPPGGCERNG
jgi:hypothetical protein